jgi:carbonic anhydrase
MMEQLENETGVPPEWSAELSGDLEDNVREAVAQITTSPFLARTASVRGFVYEVETGRLREVV